MDTQRGVGLPWLVLLFFGLGGIGSLRGAGYGQETVPQAEVGTTAVEEVQQLNATLGDLYKEGKYTASLPFALRVLALTEQALGSTHPDVAMSLNRLAVLYHTQGQYAKAEPLHQRALSIREQALGSTHPTVAMSLNNLAALYDAQGRYPEAEPLYHRALSIREQALGPTHPDVATSLANLAVLYVYQGQYAEAMPLLHRALRIRERALRPTHPDVATSLTALAVLAFAQGDHAHAVQLHTRSSDIDEHTLVGMLTLGTEAQKLASAVTFHDTTNLIVSLHAGFAPHDLQALRLALTTVLRRKGRVLDAIADTVAALRRRLQPADQQLLAQWTAARGQLATLMLKGPGTYPPESYRAQLARLETQAQQLDAQLSTRSAAFRTQTQPVTLEQVQAAIPQGAALVELAVYTPFMPPQQWGAERYVAYVLPRQGAPAWVDLGEAAPIEQAVERFRADLSSPFRLRIKDTARALDELVLRPIRPLLGTARHVLLAPDGVLNLIPFGALVDETQHYVIERFTVSYLTTGRDLLRSPSPRPVPQPPLVVGHPEFDPPKPSLAGQVTAVLSAFTSRRSADGHALRFVPLPGTAHEATAVHRLLRGSQLWTGPAASEAALKQVQRPRLLHLATHGFFLTDQPSPPRPTRALQVVSAEGLASSPGLPIENPLLRSGLALAGANVPQPGSEDGLLTALEVAGLDLWGTALVVLSACDTGVGEVRTGEGVYGLRRALVIAGADSQLMSLWKVDDEATRDLMIAYYRRLLAGDGRAEALRQVQLAILASPKQQHPFYWAAFILSGAWTPLPRQ